MSATKTAREKGKSDFLIDMSILKTIEDFTMDIQKVLAPHSIYEIIL